MELVFIVAASLLFSFVCEAVALFVNTSTFVSESLLDCTAESSVEMYTKTPRSATTMNIMIRLSKLRLMKVVNAGSIVYPVCNIKRCLLPVQ